jgi:peptide/nickel transport system ATP-binding protein
MITDLPAPKTQGDGPELLKTVGLTRHFRLGGPFSNRYLHAVDDVDLTIGENEIVALVGESGSGKSTIARLIAMVYKPTKGEIFHRGRALSTLRSRREVLAYRGHVPMVFQDPYGSLSPVYHVAHGLLRALKLHRPDLSRQGRQEEAERILESVGLTPAADFLTKYPYELSGGQRQRIGFAQALACRPELILADEPVSMLDVSVRIGVLNLMSALRRREAISFLYITHDIASARYVADRLIVMYAGQVAESGPVEDVLAHPKHPYTQLLLSAVPDPHAPVALPATSEVAEPPRVINPVEGCRFRERCPYAVEECARVTPRLRVLRPAHAAACHVATSDMEGSTPVEQPAHLA